FDFADTLPAALRERLEHLPSTESAVETPMAPEDYYLKNVGLLLEPIEWDSDLPRAESESGQAHQYRVLTESFGPRIEVVLQYQLHTFGRQQQEEQQRQR